MSAAGYVELACASNFSFLEGASHPDEYAVMAKAVGLSGFALTDRNTLAGVVRAHLAAKEMQVPFHVGCRLALEDAPDILAYPTDRAAYGRLARLLTHGKRRAPKGECWLWLEDLLREGEGMVLIVVPPSSSDVAEPLQTLIRQFPQHVYLAASRPFGPADQRRMARLAALAERSSAPLVAVGDALYHDAARRPLADVLACVRHGCTIEEAGFKLEANAERHLKPPAEMARLFAGYEAALARTAEIAGRLAFSLDELKYEYPDEPCHGFDTPQETLEHLARQGAGWRYPQGVPERVSDGIEHELAIIAALDYARYFLTVYDIVQFARGRGILCQGRGSAANSVVCFCLGITSVDPARMDLLFERFVSAERNEPPDIDVDFEHERREEVIQYIYRKYGRHRAGIAATVITYRAKSAIRDVGKAMGLSLDVVDKLAGTVWGWSSDGVETSRLDEIGLDPADPRLAHALALAGELIGFPRHLGQHSGGFVITCGPLEEVIPIGNAAMAERTFVEWDKDDLERLGMLKIDVLALGMLSCIRKALDLLERHYQRRLDLATIPPEDPATYAMCARADTVGVFQIESRAQMSMLPRLKPKTFYDLVIEVAIVRPGPIQGDMVHPYLRRRQGLEPVDFPSEELRGVLGRTMGVPLFQEQAMKIAIVAAGFTPNEADRLRRAMASWRKTGILGGFEERLIDGMVARGYDRDFAERCFKQIEGFGEYGFPESHAASFALLVYASAWIKCHYPEVFACAILNSQPMGFYSASQLVRDARQHGVEVRPVDVNLSGWDCHLEDGGNREGRPSVRLGFRQVKGAKKTALQQVIACRPAGGYEGIRQIYRLTGLGPEVLERLAEADGFASLGLDRRTAYWQIEALGRKAARAAPDDLPLFAAGSGEGKALQAEPAVALEAMPLSQAVAQDYRSLRLSLKAHPLSFLRAELDHERITPCAALARARDGARLSAAGIVMVRQRPGSAKGVIFMTLEDEGGIANVIVWPKTFERFRAVVLGARLVGVAGRLQSEDGVIHLVAHRLWDLSRRLAAVMNGDLAAEPAPADEARRGSVRDPREAGAERDAETRARAQAILPRGRNFH